ncbi:MAG: divalent metal cation transporter [OM182 bacterium]|uniref:Divalent metal cation transporter n=1 Tax=OM182 bacterium TaxID=2510334 RepID=A0A520RW45_9GAMM|nr:MAG: divalent metal cation transporter [OM182 bacterium]
MKNLNLKVALAALGPGLLYAAVAVGVSHLVQATSAGAEFGLSMVLIVIFACLMKYPGLRFGGEYAAATGKNLVVNYRERGWLVFGLFSISQIFSMVFIIAAVSLFTSGLLQVALGFQTGPIMSVFILLVLVTVLLMTGHYKVLERVIKAIVVGFTILTTLCMLLVINRLDWSLSAFALPTFDGPTVLFIVALVGFMPSPTDASILQSLWTVARSESEGRRATKEESRFDFNVGYITSCVLAIFFLFLGTAVLFESGVEMPPDNAGFARRLLEVYTSIIGGWSYYIMAITALCVMLSTALTVTDGMTRMALAIGGELFPGPHWCTDRFYNIVLIVLSLAALLVIWLLLQSFATFMDMTSVIVFIIGPFLALLNHLAIYSEEIPREKQPSQLIRIWSMVSIVSLFLLMAVYAYYRLFA